MLTTVSFSCGQDKSEIVGETEWQKKMNADFKDASKSPLKKKDLKEFKTLDFFNFDSTFVVQASLKRTPDSEWFDMPTTTERLTKERIYGVLTFKISNNEYSLNVFQGQRLMNTKGFRDYLFLPFLDDTNGDSTYGGGRYIELRIPKDDTIEIDFNKAYNPYCAYNEKYSCPIVPRENYLPLKVEAGVKAFVK